MSAINSPMPGKVGKVCCNAGDRVEENQVVFVLEAMKMEIDVVSPSAGVIDQIMVAKGDAVQSDSVLAILK
jgi:biotin carboxyl carrier protein